MSAAEVGFEEIKPDLTPMIDVVFLLIIFFMVVNEISKMQLHEGIVLPLASQARVDDTPPPGRLVLNIDREGVVWNSNRSWDNKSLTRLLQIEAKVSAGPDGFSKRAVLLRSDGRAKYADIAQIMFLCQTNKIWKLSFGTKPIDPSTGQGVGD